MAHQIRVGTTIDPYDMSKCTTSIPEASQNIETMFIDYHIPESLTSYNSEFTSGDPNMGIYSLNYGAPMLLGILVPNSRLEIQRLYNVYNIERQIIGDDTVVLEQKVFKQMKDVLEIYIGRNGIAEIVGLMEEGGLMKVQINMNHPDQITNFSNLGHSGSEITEYFVDEIGQTYGYINEDNEFYVKKIEPSFMPREYIK